MPENTRVAALKKSAHGLIAIEETVPGLLQNEGGIRGVGHIENEKAVRAGLKQGKLSIARNFDLTDRLLVEFEVAHRKKLIASINKLANAESARAFCDEDEISRDTDITSESSGIESGE
jgi:hypothetical protein